MLKALGNKALGNKALGQWGEAYTQQWLEGQGYQTLAKNWRAGRLGELDLIMWAPNDTILVFIEVKTRMGQSHGQPQEAITPKKQAQLQAVAQAFLDAQPEVLSHAPDVRFDVVALTLDEQGVLQHCKHLCNVLG